MRVLHILKAKGISGAERHLLVLLPGLRAAGIDVRVCVLVAGDGGAYVDALRTSDLEVSPIDAGPDVNPLAYARIVRHVRAVRPDLVHTHLVHADLHGLPAARRCAVPAVSSVHTSPSYFSRRSWRWAEHLVRPLARRRIAISDHVERAVLANKSGYPGRVDVVPYGVEVGAWTGLDQRDARARLDIEARDGDVVVGIASRLIAGKGHTVLLDALASSLGTSPQLRLAIAGDGELRPSLEERARSRAPGRVQFLGFVNDMPAFMAACDVVAFPTEPERDEGFGLVVLEAMASGRPVIATDYGPIPEIVERGVTGLLVPPRSDAALAGALTTLAGDVALRARMGDAGRLRAETTFGVDAMVDGTIRVYERATAR